MKKIFVDSIQKYQPRRMPNVFSWLLIIILLVVCIWLVCKGMVLKRLPHLSNATPVSAPQSYFYVQPEIPQIIEAEVTMYNPVAGQCDDTPNIMASGKEVYLGTVACPGYLAFGQKVRIDGIVMTCEDRMGLRYRNGNYFDILGFNYEEAMQWGRQNKLVEILR